MTEEPLLPNWQSELETRVEFYFRLLNEVKAQFNDLQPIYANWDGCWMPDVFVSSDALEEVKFENCSRIEFSDKYDEYVLTYLYEYFGNQGGYYGNVFKVEYDFKLWNRDDFWKKDEDNPMLQYYKGLNVPEPEKQSFIGHWEYEKGLNKLREGLR